MTAAQRPDDAGLITLGELMGAMRRQWRILALFALLGLLAAVGMVLRSSSNFTAESQLVIDPITTDPFAANSRPIDSVNPATERSVITGSAVAEEVIDRLDLFTTPSNLLGRVEVENPEESLTLIVSTTASTPEKAQALADTFAEVYLDQRRAIAEEAVSSVVATIDSELASTEDELAAAIASSAGLAAGSFQAQQVEAQIATLRTRLATLESRRTDLVSATTVPGRITRKADLPSTPGGLPPIALGAGVFIAVMSAGALVALLYDRRGGRVRDQSGIEAIAPGASIQMVGGAEEALEAAVGVMALDLLDSGAEPIMSGITSTDSSAPTGTADRLVVALVSSGRRVLVIWSGPRSELPDARLKWPVLEEMCSGTLDDLYEQDRTSVWVVAESGAGATALARDNAASDVRTWASRNGFDVVLVASPSAQFQPAVAGFARYLDFIALASVGLPRRSDLAGAVAALSNYGVDIDRVLVDRSSGGGA